MRKTGFNYFLDGFKMALHPQIRKFVLLPLLANCLVIGGVLWYLFSNLQQWIDGWLSHLPQWLDWLSFLLLPLFIVTILGVFSYFFSTLANFIAAPFNGLLAEKVEQVLTNQKTETTFTEAIKDLPRIMKREWRKLCYTLPKVFGLFLLMFIPVIGQTVVPLLWLLFTAWMLAIQYCDYPFDNNKVDFDTMRMQLKQRQFNSYSFGILVSIFTTIPLLNLFIMPVAVCSATIMWVEDFSQE